MQKTVTDKRDAAESEHGRSHQLDAGGSRPAHWIQPKEVDAEPPIGSGGGGGSDGGPAKVWTISGKLCVRESEIDGVRHDRNLEGVEVKISASDLGASGPWTEWGTVRTNVNGDFTLRETNNGKDRFFRVEARLVGSDLEVNDSDLELDLFDRNWRTVWKSGVQREGPAVSVGTRVFAAGGAEDLGNETYRRQALVWYVLRSAIDRLEAEESWFAMNRKITAIYPAHAIGGSSYANGLTRMIYLHKGPADDDWHPGVVLHEFMHLWNYDHNHGTINWLGAVCSLRGEHPFDGTTHNPDGENPNVAFAEGCSEWASNALLHEIWGVRERKPLGRRYVFQTLGLTTLERVEKSDWAVAYALHLLSNKGETLPLVRGNGWWTHLFGSIESYAEGRAENFPEEAGAARLPRRLVPDDVNSLSMWDVLRTFRASPANGWDSDWQVGNVDYGLLRFFDRAVDIHHLGEDVRVMLKRCIDPLATDEPRDELALATLRAFG